MTNDGFEAAAAKTALRALDTADKVMAFSQKAMAGGRLSGDALHAHAQAVRQLVEAARVLREAAATDQAETARSVAPSMSSQRIR